MPVHTFIHEPTQETIDIYVPLSAPAEAHCRQKQGGKTYRRVYTVPLAAHDMTTRRSDATLEDFRKVTSEKKNLKVGEMQEIAAEMRAHRAERAGGLDPVTEEFYRKHEKDTGETHPDVVRRAKVADSNAKLAEMGIKMTL